jgi:ribose-phosphate pyrophosphokinase
LNYFNPANLAVIACPGGEVFADDVIAHLKIGYRRNIEKTAQDISKRYNIDIESANQQINLINEIMYPSSSLHFNHGKVSSPKFKIKTKFTIFANSEIK